MHPVRARIDLDALTHNFHRVREAAPGRRILAVVKADAYGHGLLRVARRLGAADGFCVARVHEGVALRRAGVSQRILVLGGFASAQEVRALGEHRLDPVLHHASQLDLLAADPAGDPLDVWVKIDTGMHRLGFPPPALDAVWSRLRASPRVARRIRLMTHLACADDRRDRRTQHQLDTFAAAAEGVEAEASIANSAAVLGWPDAHAEWVRPGIMLYGISPFNGGVAANDGLRPVMTLSTRLCAVNTIRKGGAIGYGGTWVCPEEMPVGVAAIGYGDGYPRHAQSGTPVLVNGERAALIGRVSMDTIAVDLRAQPRARPGDPVVLWGHGLPVEEIARHAGTIGYELVTRLTGRVRFEATSG